MYRSQSLHSTAINMTEHLGNAGRGNDTTSSRPAPVGGLTGDGSKTNKRSQGVSMFEEKRGKQSRVEGREAGRSMRKGETDYVEDNPASAHS